MIAHNVCLCLNKQALFTCLHVWQRKQRFRLLPCINNHGQGSPFTFIKPWGKNSHVHWQKFHLPGRRLGLFLNCKNSYHCSRTHLASRVHVYNTANLTLLWLKYFIKIPWITQLEIAEKKERRGKSCIGFKLYLLVDRESLSVST